MLLFAVVLPSCSGIARDMGIEETSDLEQREGTTGGSMDNPQPLDPFKRYDIVLSANECRVYSLKIPSKWSWKVSLTVANRTDGRRGRLTADILPKEPSWGELAGCYSSKSFDLGREGSQVLLGIGNPGEDRVAFLKLCQDGAPLKVTMTSQISASKALLGPNGSVTPIPGGD